MAIGGYWWLLVVILSIVIGDYSVVSHCGYFIGDY
jgi:hypothetical protein